MDGIGSVHSLYSARSKRRVGRYLLPVMTGDLSSPERLEQARQELRQHPLVQGRMLSEDERSTLVVARLDENQDDVVQIEPVLSRINGVLAGCTNDTSVTATVTGVPAIRVEVIRTVKRDQVVFAGIGLLLATGIAWLLFRNWSTLVIVVAAPVLGVVGTLGLLGWVGENLNVVNSVLVPLILVIGFMDAVHLMFHIRGQRKRGRTRYDAVRSALREIGPACLLTSLTTGIGFGSLVFSGDEVIRRFGLACAAGTTVTLLAVLLVVPLLAGTPLGDACGKSCSPRVPLARFLARWLDKSRSKKRRRTSARKLRGRIVYGATKFPRVIAGAAVLCTVGMFVLSLNLKSDYRYAENLPTGGPVSQALERCEAAFGGSSTVQVVVQYPQDHGLRTAELHEVVEEVHGVLRQQPLTQSPVSIRSVLMSLPGEGENPRSRLSELRYVPREDLSRFVLPDQRRLTVAAPVPDKGAAELQPAFEDIQRQLAQIEALHPGYRLQLTGLPVLSAARSRCMIDGLAKSLALASVAIFVVIAVTFRSLRLGLISIVPNAFPLVATGALLMTLGQPLQYTSALVFNVCLGVAVDDKIHFLARYRRAVQRGDSTCRSIHRTLHRIAPVLLTTTILMVAGISVPLLSAVPTIRLFAGLSCWALVWALCGDLVLLPALVACFGRLGSSDRRAPAPETSTPSRPPRARLAGERV